jgi:cytochrome P450
MEQDMATAVHSDASRMRSPVGNFDFYFDTVFSAEGDHLPSIAKLNTAPPIFWSTAQGGYWVIRGYEQVFEAARATDLFSSRSMNIPRDDTELQKRPAIPINLDPPTHGLFREPLARLFGPQRMARLEARIRERAVGLVDAVRDQGGCDFVKAIAEPLPVHTFMDLVGMNHDNLREFRELAIVGSVDPDQDKRKRASAEIARIMSEFVDDRIANPQPDADDITNELIALQIDNRPITSEEIKSYFQLLFFAGLDTVVNAVTFGISQLARHPELQARVRGDMGNIRLVVEELLRLGAPAKPGRMVARDELWHGVQFYQGDRVMLELTAANLDPAVFPDAQTFDLGRGNISHLAFNAGPHRCVGQHLARIELKVMYEEFLGRIPQFGFDPDNLPIMHGGMVMGVDTLPLRW